MKNRRKAEKDSKEQEEVSVLREILSTSLYLLIVFVLTLFIVKFVAQRTVVIGHSMEDTLQDKDSLIVEKLSYRFGEPERFDIVVFPFEYENDIFYIKRVIGLPGETVRIDDLGNIYINDKLLIEDYGTEVMLDPGLAYYPIEIGEDEYFVLGDNRNHSSDSRTPAVGLVKKEDLVGRAIFRIFPFNKIGKIE